MSTESFSGRCATRFRPERLLGQGGFGDVWLATQIELERPVAIKFIRTDADVDPEQLKRFENEAQVTARLSHPSIVKVIDHDVEDGVPWIAYEYLPGRSLAQVLERGPLHWEQALAVAQQIAGALEEAHRQGVIHRDIMPDNVLEVEPGRYKLADFGIAKWTASTQVRTKTGFIMGTPTHVPPEQIQGEAASPQGDVYALGVVLYQMLTGRLPFRDESMIGLLRQHLEQDPTTPSRVQKGLPPVVDSLVKQALEKTPGKRFADGGEMRRALEAVPRSCGADSAARPAEDLAPPLADGGTQSIGRMKRPRLPGADSGTRAVTRAAVEPAPAQPAGPPLAVRARLTAAGAAIFFAGIVVALAFLRPPPPPGPARTAVTSPPAPPTTAAPAERDKAAGLDGRLRAIRRECEQFGLLARRARSDQFSALVVKNASEVQPYLEKALTLTGDTIDFLIAKGIKGPVWAGDVFVTVDPMLDRCTWIAGAKGIEGVRRRIDSIERKAAGCTVDGYARFFAASIRARQAVFSGTPRAGARQLRDALADLETQGEARWLSSIAGVRVRQHVAAEIASLLGNDAIASVGDPRSLAEARRQELAVYEELARAPGNEDPPDATALEDLLCILSKQIDSSGRIWRASYASDEDRARAESHLRDAVRRLRKYRFPGTRHKERDRQIGKAAEILRDLGK